MKYKYKEQISIRVTKFLKKELSKKAKEEGYSVSELIRKILEREVHKWKRIPLPK